MIASSDTQRQFVQSLTNFAQNGFRFDSGDVLRAGTQQDAVMAYVQNLEQGEKHGHFEIPTGVGKTAIFISLIDQYLKAAKAAKGGERVLVVVPSNDLVIQTAKAFAKFLPEITKIIEADDDLGREIDWENSEVGVQYNKLHHAKNKPNILITTYQSLARDKENKTYSPEEYGFIVYDEGHFVTGKTFSKSVEKFQNAIQLAVTATREYSETKNVQSLLPHLYYQLSVAEAIERGDLCNVQPILVHTDYAINESQFDEFFKSQGSLGLSDDQKQQLFNQEKRNRAMIETYLGAKDEYSGQTFFGQTGMVYAAGIKHCNDLERQLRAALNEAAYHPLREWMEREGIALSAKIHSNTSGETLTIGGETQFYTKDEIKFLHKQGKILLLISDQELKQGTDFPRDSIIMDMVDRHSVVDCKQRYGRGFRLDPSDSDKVCKVFNFVDQNTQEVYKDHPEYLPIYCAEVLEGAKFRPARVQGDWYKHFKEKPPEIDPALVQGNFEVVCDIERVQGMSQKIKEARPVRPEYPKKTEDHLRIATNFATSIGMSIKNPKYLVWRKRVEDQIKAGEQPMIGSYPVQIMNAGGGKYPICVHKKAGNILAKELGRVSKRDMPFKTEHYLALRSEMKELIGLSYSNSSRGRQYNQWVDETERQIEEGGRVYVGGYEVSQMVGITGQRPYCLHKDAADALCQTIGIERRAPFNANVKKSGSVITETENIHAAAAPIGTTTPAAIALQKAKRKGWAKSKEN